MLDIKLKNSRKFRIICIVIGILILTVINISLFPWIIRNASAKAEAYNAKLDENIDMDAVSALYQGAYVLYAELWEAENEQLGNRTNLFITDEKKDTSEEQTQPEEEIYDYISDWEYRFEEYRLMLDYYATDGTNSEKNTNRAIERALEDGFDIEDKQGELKKAYQYYLVLNFDENGILSVDVERSTDIPADLLIKSFLKADRENLLKEEAAAQEDTFRPITNFWVVYGISSSNLPLTYDNYYTSDYYMLSTSGASGAYYITLAVILAFMFLMTSKKIWKTEKMPDYLPEWRYMEPGILGVIFSLTLNDVYIDTIRQFPEDVVYSWGCVSFLELSGAFVSVFAIYALVFVTCLTFRPLFAIGLKEYIRQYSFTYQIFPWLKKMWNGFAEEMSHIDFNEKSTKKIIKVVAVNFFVLAVLMCMWMFGIIGLIFYSIALFYILTKYYDKIAANYRTLLKGTNRIADGDLDTVITEDLGVFEPFKGELTKIRSGFKKAVEEEVKSQRMKTELITNVSHDLKTPLTAITTYVELLKKENLTEEERKSYIETLEKKSLRLKVLIEDLFEVSKATSNNITLNFIDVDVINLMKQVSVEHTDKFEAAGLQLKWNVPQEKVILKLDNQKTYRIFENLFVNIQKYAMPDSRVYIDVVNENGKVTITMKNMSAVELNIRPDELTERFVRGDASRNTEGSGLGLAIAKSFTEAQNGNFVLAVDGDLFKVTLQFFA